MRIGIPKENHKEERRIALTPAGVDALVRAGHSVFIESGAGIGSNFSDEDFVKIGATTLKSKEEVYDVSEMVVKVATITESEVEMLRENQVLFAFLHLAVSNKKIITELLKKKITAIGYELIEKDGGLPILHSMSEIAGQLAIQVAERYLESFNIGGRGVLLGGIPGVAPSVVVVLGAGVVGRTAARAAFGIGAQVIVLDNDLHRLRRFETEFRKRITTVVANTYTITRAIKLADVFIGAVLIKGEKTPHLVTEDMVKQMKKGSVIVDVSIDQGGCVETSRLTTISDPVYMMHDVIHYCVPNMPALVSRTASYGLNNAAFRYVQNIAENGLSNTLLEDSGLAKGVCTYRGYCSNEAIADIFKVEFRRLRVFSTN
jgi:alanine dehydrogenase